MGVFGELFSWWNGQTLGTRLFTMSRGALVGTDGQGNRYYEERKLGAFAHKRRWVIYNGEVEASRVPPEWHGWLHQTVNEPPTVAPPVVKPWEQPHQPNLTGSRGAYHPPGSLYQDEDARARPRAYEPWRPE